jgi:hypothetical protein
MSWDEIFHPSASHAKDHLNAEKILPAPTPAAGDKPLLGVEDDLYIPPVTGGAMLPEPPEN